MTNKTRAPRRFEVLSTVFVILLGVALTWAQPARGKPTDAHEQTAGRVDASRTMAYWSQQTSNARDAATASSATLPRPNVPLTAITVVGTVAFDTGGPVEGALVVGRIPPAHQGFLPLIRKGTSGGASTAGPQPAAGLSMPPNQALTDANGNFALIVQAEVPVRVLVEVQFEPTGLPIVETARWHTAEGSTLDVGTLLIPNPQGAEITLQGGNGESADASVRVTGMPTEVDRLFARAYDPDEQADAFPGEFAENGAIPLDSAMFLWMEGLDSAGNPVDSLSGAAILGARVPASQWADLEDIESGTCCIEVPLYAYDETGNLWQQEGTGWLEDTDGRALPEDAQALLLDGTYGGDVYAVFRADHLSYYNVDYPFIGPWTLSRLSEEERNNDCLYRALKAAEAVWNTRWASDAYSDVNKPDANFDLSEEVPPGQGPEIMSMSSEEIDGDWGWSREEDFAENIHLNADLWKSCDSHPGETALGMKVTILHETAHWKHAVKKHDGDYEAEEDEVGGEAGDWIEDWLYGGKIIDTITGDLPIEGGLEIEWTPDGGGTERRIITPDQIEDLLDPNWWRDNDPNFYEPGVWDDFWHPQEGAGHKPGEDYSQPEAAFPVQITLSMDSSYIELGEPILVDVEYRNASAQPVSVLGLTVLQSYPLFFQVRDSNGDPVPFVGPKIKYGTGPQDFVELAPGETLERSVDLMRDAGRGTRHFGFLRGGTYEVKATYTRWHGLSETESNTVSFTLGNGGSLAGTVSSADSGAPIAGATVEAILDGERWATATCDSSGNYDFPELPPGDYVLTAGAPGFRHQTLAEVGIVKDQHTTADFHLPLLEWTRTVVDSDGDVGAFSSVATDGDGWAHISYSDDTGPGLKYAYQDASGWHVETVDDETKGWWNSLALDADGYAHISYYTGPYTFADLKYAYQDADGWHDETVDTDLGTYSSLALDEAGETHISYCAGWGGTELRYAHLDAAGWHIETVDDDIGDCEDTSLALDGDGRAHVAYFDADAYEVKYAREDAGGWQIVVVEDEQGSEGGGTSLALDSEGYAHISYVGGASWEVKHAYWDGAGLHIEVVEEATTNTTSLALGPGDLPYIAYPDWDFDTWSVLAKLAYHDGYVWHIEAVDTDLGYTSSVSVALDTAGWTHVSYYDDANGDLMYAR